MSQLQFRESRYTVPLSVLFLVSILSILAIEPDREVAGEKGT